MRSEEPPGSHCTMVVELAGKSLFTFLKLASQSCYRCCVCSGEEGQEGNCRKDVCITGVVQYHDHGKDGFGDNG